MGNTVGGFYWLSPEFTGIDCKCGRNQNRVSTLVVLCCWGACKEYSLKGEGRHINP